MQVPVGYESLAHDTLCRENDAAIESARAAERRARWAVVYGLVPQKDGDQWFILLGANLMDGISGFGSSPEKAIEAFDIAMASNKGDACIDRQHTARR